MGKAIIDPMAKILIVEDEVDLAELIKNWLAKEHHLVETADDGLEALIRMETNNFDVVVLDIMLPSLNGLEICRRYRKGGGKAGIIMLTAKGHVDEKEDGLRRRRLYDQALSIKRAGGPGARCFAAQPRSDRRRHQVSKFGSGFR